MRFLEKCLEEDLIPEGLRIKLEPQAFMSTRTNIRETRNKTLRQMSKTLTQTLVDHYEKLLAEITPQIEAVKDDLLDFPFLPTPQELHHHEQTMEKTEENLKNHEEALMTKSDWKNFVTPFHPPLLPNLNLDPALQS